MGVLRALQKQPKLEKAPKDARCYICLDGDDATGKLMRGCACRGASAGYVHLECLSSLAVSKEDSRDPYAVITSWTTCGNCTHSFAGRFELEIKLRFWRRYRSQKEKAMSMTSSICLADCLDGYGEADAANYLYDNVECGESDYHRLNKQLRRADALAKDGRSLEALDLLKATARQATDDSLYVQTMSTMSDVLRDLHRPQEAYDILTDVVKFAQKKFGHEHQNTLVIRNLHAAVLVQLDRRDESYAIYNDVLAAEARILGPDHPLTQETRQGMQNHGFTPT